MHTRLSPRKSDLEFFFFDFILVYYLSIYLCSIAGQRVVGEPVASGLVLDDSGLWDPDFYTAAKQEPISLSITAGHGKALQAALSTGVLQVFS
ncbi:unnamed protein product [Coffea canephora]|uniref:DH200=94 genomic scaffold, scaffold_2155 n=1 Tax=Coffea canephora TaxID=49390 RepID=A0A068VJF3_COFCA|nr:unnamed protein product [Coffea canephora]